MLEAKENIVKLTPRKDCVLLAPFPDDARNAGPRQSIVLTDEYQNEPSQYSKIVAVGAEVLDLKPGDTVFSQRYPKSAWSFKFNGHEIVSVKYDEILAKIEMVN
jgi:co-chaperonin GroES (HSP10)